MSNTASCTGSAGAEALTAAVREKLYWQAIAADWKTPLSQSQEKQAREIVDGLEILIEYPKSGYETNHNNTTRFVRRCSASLEVTLPSKVSADPDLLKQWSYAGVNYTNSGVSSSERFVRRQIVFELQMTDDNKNVAEIVTDEGRFFVFAAVLLGRLQMIAER